MSPTWDRATLERSCHFARTWSFGLLHFLWRLPLQMHAAPSNERLANETLLCFRHAGSSLHR